MRKVYVRTKAVSEIFWVGKKIQSMYDALIVFIFLLFFFFFFVQLDNNKRVVCRIANACHTCGAPADAKFRCLYSIKSKCLFRW